MKEIPILFSAPMVRAIIEGRKTQTRRVVTHPMLYDLPKIFNIGDGWWGDESIHCLCPYGKPGDRLWVRETWRLKTHDLPTEWPFEYRATAEQDLTPTDGPWKPSIYMPRAASRITLKVLGVMVERLHDISEADAIAEGIEFKRESIMEAASGWKPYGSGKHNAKNPVESYRTLWESINGPGSWDENPWVWVVKFKNQSKFNTMSKIEKITPQIAALYLGQKCDMKFHKLGKSEVKITVGRIGLLERDAITMTPHLRRLESITEQEARELYEVVEGCQWFENPGEEESEDFVPKMALSDWFYCQDEFWFQKKEMFIGIPAAWLYLLSRGFDLFNLIDLGLAKEITTKTNEL